MAARAPSAARFGALGRALSHRDARLFFFASVVSWTGLWVHRIAVTWLAWELTGSAAWVGMVAFCDLAPAVFFNAAAYLVATVTMPLLRVAPDQRRGHAPEASVWAEAAAGFRYAGRHPGIGPILLYAAVASVLMRGVP